MIILGEPGGNRNPLHGFIVTTTVLSGIQPSRPMKTQTCRLPTPAGQRIGGAAGQDAFVSARYKDVLPTCRRPAASRTVNPFASISSRALVSLADVMTGRRPPLRPRALATAKPAPRAFTNEIPLEVRQCGEQVKRQPAAGRRRVDVFRQRLEAHATLGQLGDDRQQGVRRWPHWQNHAEHGGQRIDSEAETLSPPAPEGCEGLRRTRCQGTAFHADGTGGHPPKVFTAE